MFWVEVTLWGDESVVHIVRTCLSPTSHLNIVQRNDFEQPSCSDLVEFCQNGNNTIYIVSSRFLFQDFFKSLHLYLPKKMAYTSQSKLY